MDLARIPFAESHQWVVLRAITAFTDDPILALNLFFLFGFFAVGFFGFLLFRATVKVGWMAMLLSIAAATIPWHYSRFHHTLLADYSPVPAFLLLAFLMWKAWWAESNARLALGILCGVYIGTGGVYYAFFACLILAPVLLGQIWTTRRTLAWWRDGLVVAVIPIAVALSLAAHQSLAMTLGEGASLKPRSPIMSLAFAGEARTFFTPWPFRDSATEGSAQYSLIVTLSVLVVIGVLVALALRADGLRRRDFPEAELVPWLRLLVWTLLWFVPGGLGLVFSWLVTPEIRSWGRLSIVVAFICLVIAGIFTRWVIESKPRWYPVIAAGIVLLATGQIALDHRSIVLPDAARTFDAEAREYADQIARAVEPGCPILQLPVMSFPEDWREGEMAAYDHFWIPIYSSQYRWSFGSNRGTSGGGQSESRYADDLAMEEVLTLARDDGYCAIHIDELGMDDRSLAELERLLGDPEAHIGRWALQALDGGENP